jgi:hypothetical protein
MSMLAYWVVTPYGLVAPEDGGSVYLRNDGAYLPTNPHTHTHTHTHTHGFATQETKMDFFSLVLFPIVMSYISVAGELHAAVAFHNRGGLLVHVPQLPAANRRALRAFCSLMYCLQAALLIISAYK